MKARGFLLAAGLLAQKAVAAGLGTVAVGIGLYFVTRDTNARRAPQARSE